MGIRAMIAAVAAAALVAPALGSEEVKLDLIAPDVGNYASLQSGARTFVNYCLNCHSANLMRYNQLVQIGLTETQIRDNLLFTAEKVGEPMAVALRKKDAKQWFGTAPPDLSVVARSRGPDWLYTYLRGFYRDASTQTGWNNTVFPNVAMPHVLWILQGERVMKQVELMRDGKPVLEHGKPVHVATFETLRPGSQTAADYDQTVYDLVNFLTWAGEPQQVRRKQIGILVLFGLTILISLTWLLKREFWKDVQ
jgi:ubiquinol-cytochrome c reductase cytochrome c1 subunit